MTARQGQHDFVQYLKNPKVRDRQSGISDQLPAEEQGESMDATESADPAGLASPE